MKVVVCFAWFTSIFHGEDGGGSGRYFDVYFSIFDLYVSKEVMSICADLDV